jgi:regulator of nucleoside diphosphate kinase
MQPISLSKTDFDVLSALLQSAASRELAALEHDPWRLLKQELERAIVVPPGDLPSDTVRMNSSVILRDLESGEEQSVRLVFPTEEDWERCNVSVLAPVGLAILGYRAGDVVCWKVPAGRTKLKILQVA